MPDRSYHTSHARSSYPSTFKIFCTISRAPSQNYLLFKNPNVRKYGYLTWPQFRPLQLQSVWSAAAIVSVAVHGVRSTLYLGGVRAPRPARGNCREKGCCTRVVSRDQGKIGTCISSSSTIQSKIRKGNYFPCKRKKGQKTRRLPPLIRTIMLPGVYQSHPKNTFE